MKKHVRYIGNAITIFCAVMMIVFVVCPIIAIPFIFSSEVSISTIFISVCCALTSLLFVVYLRTVSNQLYTWCIFGKDGIIIRTLFQKKYRIDYTKCFDVGIGCYTHGVLNSNFGSKVPFIYLSYDRVDEKFKSQMNLLKPSKTCVKIGFHEKTYQFLLNCLPSKQAIMLQKSYTRFFSK